MATKTETDIALIKQSLGYIEKTVNDINISISQNYTPLNDFLALKDRVDKFHKNFTYLSLLAASGVIAAIVKWVLSGGLK